MPAPEAVAQVETFTRALDSVCKWLQLRLDEDAANGKEPMEDMVRMEVEEELERLTVLRSEISDTAKLRPSILVKFLTSNKEEILKALDYYEKRLQSSMKAAEKDSYRPPFKKSQKELELVKFAKQSLTE
jgi:hypothetical protein